MRESPEAESTEPEPSPATPAPKCDYDWSIALETVQGDRDLLRELVSTYATESPQLLRQMHSAIATGDAKLLQRAAHTLKSSLRYFGGGRLVELAFTLENQGRAGTVTDAAPLLADLESQLPGFTSGLQAFAATDQTVPGVM